MTTLKKKKRDELDIHSQYIYDLFMWDCLLKFKKSIYLCHGFLIWF